MKILLHYIKIFYFVLLLLAFSGNTVFGQTIGDYRSNVNATGSWTIAGSWEYYNGSTWVAATNYPGQIAGSYAVLIQAGDEINIGTSGITTQTMGTLTISGSLVLTGINTGSIGTDFVFNTQTIIVTPLLGTIAFIDKVNLKLPTNATLQVIKDTSLNPYYYGLVGNCNHNQDVYIGNNVYAYCNGGGATALTFDVVMNDGGTLNAIAMSNSPICQGDTIHLSGSFTGATGTGLAYSWSITNPDGTVTTSSTQNPTITNAISGTYMVTLACSTTYNSNAYSNSETISVLVNALPNAPTIATTQPSCALSTGTITITGVAGETYSFDGRAFSTTLVYPGLAQGSLHTISAKNSSGCTSQVTNVTINLLSTKTWNGSWSPSLPTSNDLVVIAANYSTLSNGNINACSLVVNSGSKLTIEAEKFVIIQNDLTVNGTLEVLDKGSLVMVNDSGVVTNLGTTNIHRFTTPFKMYDYVYWSSPVTSANIATTLLGWRTGNAYEYDANIANWKYTSTMTPAKGVIVMVPNPIAGPGGNQSEVVFRGTLNNGVNKITGVVPNGSYLLGNPYPSAIDADEFLMQNVGVIGGTLSFWTHGTAIQLASNITNGSAGSGVYAYTSDDYATYNLVGGVTTKTASAGGIIPTGEIASCQGFFATCNATISGAAEIVFNNSMRLGSSGTPLDNSQFFKTTKVKRTSVVQKNRVWLSLTNDQGAFKQALIGYVTGATNGIDSLYDGESLDGNDYVDFYSITEGKNLVIQGRALPFDENDELPLGFRTTIAGAFTISIDQLDGLLVNQPVYLEDKMINTLFDLKSGNYTFNTIKGSFNDRFVLRYTAKIISGNKTLGLDETDANDGIMVLYSNNYETLIIKNNLNDATVNSVTLFNMLGQKINYWDVKDSQQTSIQIPIKNVSSEMYVVKVKTTKGESSKKIVIR